MITPNNLATLTAEWIAAKADENAANKRRIEVETQIAALLPNDGHEGTVAQAVGEYRVAVRYANTVKVDTPKLQAMWDALPEAAHKAFRWKAEADVKNLRALREFAPGDYARVVACVETRPSKPSVSITVVEREAA